MRGSKADDGILSRGDTLPAITECLPNHYISFFLMSWKVSVPLQLM